MLISILKVSDIVNTSFILLFDLYLLAGEDVTISLDDFRPPPRSHVAGLSEISHVTLFIVENFR